MTLVGIGLEEGEGEGRWKESLHIARSGQDSIGRATADWETGADDAGESERVRWSLPKLLPDLKLCALEFVLRFLAFFCERYQLVGTQVPSTFAKGGFFARNTWNLGSV